MAGQAGRPELPIDESIKEPAELARFLRARRHAAGVTYEQMSKIDGAPSASTLKRAAAGGPTVPQWPVVSAYMNQTGVLWEPGDPPERPNARWTARQLWIRARRATRAPYHVHAQPDAQLISSLADFSRALRDQHIWGGCPTPGEMEREAGLGILPRSTARRIIQGRTLPAAPEQLTAFLAISNLDAYGIGYWLAAATRLPLDDPLLWIRSFEKHEYNDSKFMKDLFSGESIDFRVAA